MAQERWLRRSLHSCVMSSRTWEYSYLLEQASYEQHEAPCQEQHDVTCDGRE
jgi:hypothetical protein